MESTGAKTSGAESAEAESAWWESSRMNSVGLESTRGKSSGAELPVAKSVRAEFTGTESSRMELIATKKSHNNIKKIISTKLHCTVHPTLTKPNLITGLIVVSSNTSRLEVYAGFFRLLMKGIFDPHVL